MHRFKKILIANRGEIAVRIIRACKEMGIKSAVVFSEIDRNSLHVLLADEKYEIGPAPANESYLRMDKIIDTALRIKADAIHPGYGFLAENPEFSEKCEENGITFIGPPSHCMAKAKPKNRARQLMKMINIPVTPGFDEAIKDGSSSELNKAREIAAELGYPVIVKPSGGGGGIGIMKVDNEKELIASIEKTERHAISAFGTSYFYIEKFIRNAKHIEFQVLADRHGNVIHLGERDCSVQRRFQKLIEEAPCPIMTPFWRMKMGAAAIDVALALEYVGALTVEFFYLPEERKFYFNEINCRLQVEHGVTEVITGIDIVKEQILIAQGEELSIDQDDIRFMGHAVECRINAEDAKRNFMPSPGKINGLRLPQGPGIRVDEGIYEGYEIPYHYDSLLMKIISHGQNRKEAICRMKRAIEEMEIDGPKTTIPFHLTILDDEDFLSGEYTTDLATREQIWQKIKQI
ncbi:MAG TPA: acetyl-CoA carboxylase biotin carboxylase subunit [Syntrophales bacterium]|nr:acetyl-CoA carboxylase biotin carboxylase subunit [Syntrophales bacterium]HOL59903.1 acetyl-CoA carboxylase biotin carboxylase subunit [Syntrophales bacterium]HPO36050.1 acetyl-CoA carboxylase biotin carboxylase subunit [Syntrophales bacterium]